MTLEKKVYPDGPDFARVGQNYWQASPRAAGIFDAFIQRLVTAIRESRAGDYGVALGECNGCHAALFRTVTPLTNGTRPAYAIFPETIARNLLAALAPLEALCPACREAAGPSSLRAFFLGRVAPLWPKALVIRLRWNLGAWQSPDYFVLSPPGSWKGLIGTPSGDFLFDMWGRAAHPLVSAVSAYRGFLDNGGLAFRRVSAESAFIAFDGTRNVERDALEEAAYRQGLSPPFLVRIWKGGTLPSFFDSEGMTASIRRLLGARSVSLAMVHSEPAIRTRLFQWAAASGKNVSSSLAGAIHVRGLNASVDSTIHETVRECEDVGMTFDDALFALGGGSIAVDPPKTPPEPGSSPPPWPLAVGYESGQALPPARETAAASPAVGAITASALTSAGPAALPPPQAPAPASAVRILHSGIACRTCGRPAFLVRRLFDPTRVSEIYRPLPVYAEKKYNCAIALMLSCGEHLAPAIATDLAAWGLSIEAAIQESSDRLGEDRLVVWRRVRFGRKNAPTLGFAGAFAASIITDPRWVEGAIRAAGVQMPESIAVRSNGENVVTIRPHKAIEESSVAKDLRRISKSWGLPEPIISQNVERRMQRGATAEGGFVIQGDI